LLCHSTAFVDIITNYLSFHRQCQQQATIAAAAAAAAAVAAAAAAAA